MCAAEAGYDHVIEVLWREAAQSEDWTMVMLTACRRHRTHLVKSLLRLQLCCRAEVLQTPLFSSSEEWEGLVRALSCRELRTMASHATWGVFQLRLFAPDGRGHSLLHEAVRCLRFDILELLNPTSSEDIAALNTLDEVLLNRLKERLDIMLY